MAKPRIEIDEATFPHSGLLISPEQIGVPGLGALDWLSGLDAE